MTTHCSEPLFKPKGLSLEEKKKSPSRIMETVFHRAELHRAGQGDKKCDGRLVGSCREVLYHLTLELKEERSKK